MLLAEGILAHEYAHLKQCEKNPELFDIKYIGKRELHADFLAGHYLSRRYVNSFMVDNSESEIFRQICLFYKNENINLNIIIAMLINSGYEYDYSLYGIDNDTSKLLRFASLWRGLSNSGVSTFDEAYRLGLEITSKLLNNPSSINTYKVFKIIGIDILTKIIRKELNYQNMIRAIQINVNDKNNGLTQKEKSDYTLVLSTMKVLKCK
ncbi:hypothetical protein GCM10027085_58320 [Spirosoma aerophilum]